ncbi:MAG: hypothetical protein JW808_04820 [Victivallales bacterium]|nr:hypothetical protein [Victivallales bacterium]
MLVDVPLPGFLGSVSDTDRDGREIPACFPIVGAALGLVAYCCSWILFALLPARTAVAMVGSVGLVLLLEITISGGNLAVLSNIISLSGNKSRDGEHVLGSSFSSAQMIYLSLYLLKIFSFALLLLYDRTSWLVIAYTMSYLVRSQLAISVCGGGSEALIPVRKEKYAVKLPWIIALVISFVVAGFHFFPAVVFVAVAAYFMIFWLKKMVVDKFGTMTSELVGAGGALSEIVFLLIGVMLLVRN